MQSGLGKTDKWILEFEVDNPTRNPLMGWESSSDTYSELKLEFSTKELAINYAKKKKDCKKILCRQLFKIKYV